MELVDIPKAFLTTFCLQHYIVIALQLLADYYLLTKSHADLNFVFENLSQYLR